jgi:hypothetical protein
MTIFPSLFYFAWQIFQKQDEKGKYKMAKERETTAFSIFSFFSLEEGDSNQEA